MVERAARFCADVTHSAHPPLSDLKALAARLAAARNLRLRMGDRGTSGIAEALLNQINAAALGVDAEDNVVPLSDFLVDLGDHLHKMFRRRLSRCAPAMRRPMRRAMTGLLRDFRTVDCRRCAKQSGREPCDGGDADKMNMGTPHAHCLQPLVSLLAVLLHLVDRAYGPWLDSLSNLSAPVKVRLETRRSERAVLRSRTYFNLDAADERAALVVVELPVLQFDDTHYGRLPYLIFHEVFVHAVESLASKKERKPTGNLCTLREGFVDKAAMTVLDSGLADKEAVAMLGDHAAFAGAFRNGCRAAHARRADLGSRGQPPAGRTGRGRRLRVKARQDGCDIFDGIVDATSKSDAIELAVGLNLLPLDQARRTAVAVALLNALDRIRGGGSTTAEKPGMEMIRNLIAAAQKRDLKAVATLVKPCFANFGEETELGSDDELVSAHES